MSEKIIFNNDNRADTAEDALSRSCIGDFDTLAILTAQAWTRSFGDIVAVDRATLSIEAGEVFGVLVLAAVLTGLILIAGWIYPRIAM